ncbi:hypothetical protein Pmar_PMAR007576 [Perkinsus marinus ATCC 50983]|uniref:Chromo domain-containing protein n=1 Tax=Perkinsus marinus (strain ATCC 50983 / TXsc) TaxID=423536 RepID=C5LKD8_PERM5|nr:hypothetical protein Pmar_PMAR007576 [Perkinsus marinus ATCC 50983]EER02820.1 hypothetical protein Pmar_PMAR007576 [Perkinsus marinus ATCC 50983]|eukprot:XP_002771004.1 hypothetical protein Pmar_PMAR007576 [Perkinsus marinus ATCC 50983]
MASFRERVDDIAQLAVGVTFDFDSNEWIAKFGNTINIFPLPNKVAETPVVEEQLGGALAGISVPKYPFEQAYIEASKWFLGTCASQRAKAAKEKGEKQREEKKISPKKRRGLTTPTEANPPKRTATEETARDDKNSVTSPPPSDAKANFPLLSKEIAVKTVHTVSDYRVGDREEEYLITGKIGSAGPLENWWIRLDNVAGNQTAISKLKNYRKNYIYRNNAARKAEAQDLAEEDADEDEDAEYEVECLLDVRIVGKKEEFLVKWKDYPPAENTWEPIANLTGVEPSELEQCRQKQAHLIVPRSSRSAPARKGVDKASESSKEAVEGGETQTKETSSEMNIGKTLGKF